MKPALDVFKTSLGIDSEPSGIENTTPVYWDSASTWDSGYWEQIVAVKGNPSIDVFTTKIGIDV